MTNLIPGEKCYGPSGFFVLFLATLGRIAGVFMSLTRPCSPERETRIDRQTDGRTGGRAGGRTDGQTDTDRHRQTDRDRQTDRQKLCACI